MLDEARKRFKLLHEADQFLEVFESGMGLRAFVILPHLRVAGFIEDRLGKFRVWHGIDKAPPTIELADEVA